jgi:hypothetical protein
MPPSAAAVMAAQVQMTRPGWLVIWSPWRRMLTAFACFAPDPIVIDEPTPERLVEQMRRTEMGYAVASSGRAVRLPDLDAEWDSRRFGLPGDACAGGRSAWG